MAKALSTSESERSRQAAQDLRIKLQLEVTMIRELRTFFREIGENLRVSMITNQTTPNLDTYRVDMVSLLKTQYRRVRRRFGDRMVRQLGKDFELDLSEKQESDDVRLAQDNYINTRANGQSDFILNTTEKDMTDAIGLVLSASLATGEFNSNEKIAKEVENDFIRRSYSRTDTIAATETSASAEGMKFIEASTIAAAGVLIGDVSIERDTVKQWDAILDERTRLNHATADGQRRSINSTFLVGGQDLLVPGDTSRGATVDNIINCRCSAQYVVAKPTRL